MLGKSATDVQEINRIFQENSDEILRAMTEVLHRYGIEGYSVHTVTISEPPKPNPGICIPYLRGIPGDGVELGCTYV